MECLRYGCAVIYSSNELFHWSCSSTQSAISNHVDENDIQLQSCSVKDARQRGPAGAPAQKRWHRHRLFDWFEVLQLNWLTFHPWMF